MIKINGEAVAPTTFSDKTSQVWKLSDNQFLATTIEWIFESEGEFLHIAQLVDLVGRHKKLSLHMPYLPYARQDKMVSNESTFALNTFAKLLNSLNFEKVTVVDVHSDKASKLINNFENIEPTKYIYKALMTTESNLICYPDKGALSRYVNLVDMEHIHGDKVRDQSTGQITNYELVGSPKDKTVLICDDIVDGGATFILLATELYKAGAKKVHLYATHGIFSKGTDILKDAGIKRIFTMNGEIQ